MSTDPNEDWMTTRSCSNCHKHRLMRIDENMCMWCLYGWMITSGTEIGITLEEEDDQKVWWERFKEYELQGQEQAIRLKMNAINKVWEKCEEHHFDKGELCSYCNLTESEAAKTNTKCQQHGHRKDIPSPQTKNTADI